MSILLLFVCDVVFYPLMGIETPPRLYMGSTLRGKKSHSLLGIKGFSCYLYIVVNFIFK